MSELRIVGIVLLAAAIGLGVGAQFVESAGFYSETEVPPAPGYGGGTFTADIKAYPWGIDYGSEEATYDWFEHSDEVGELDGEAQLQAQMVLGYIALGLVFLGTLGALFWNNVKGSYIIALGFACSLTAIILFATGIDTSYDGDLELAGGYWMSVAGVVSMFLGAIFVNRF